MGCLECYLIVMFRLDPIIDIPTCLDKTKTVSSKNLLGEGFII